MPHYVVTGGCGFIGSHLVDYLLEQDHSILVVDDLSTGNIGNLSDKVSVVRGDAADPAVVARAMEGADGCFHLAAIASVQRSNEAWLATHRTNVGGTVCVLEAARTRRIPVVYASSAAVYGSQVQLPIAECTRPAPLTAYGADKLGSELHARVAGLVHAVPTTGFRFFNVYGPRQDPRSPYSGVISIFLDRLLRGAPVDIYGDGEQVRDFVYVADVIRFLLAGMERASLKARVFNVCTGRPTSILSLARMIGEICGQRLQLRFLPRRQGDIGQSLGAPEEAARALGVTAQVGLVNGLRMTAQSIGLHQQAA
jgi:UDP-glucose 4-epimerase